MVASYLAPTDNGREKERISEKEIKGVTLVTKAKAVSKK